MSTADPAIRRRRCATCGRPLPVSETLTSFCSERCQMIDLGAWLTDGARVITTDEPASTDGSVATNGFDTPDD